MNASFTHRQLEVLALSLLLGSDGAAQQAGISRQTVKNHLSVIYRRLEVRSASQAAYRLGWLKIPEDVHATLTRYPRRSPPGREGEGGDGGPHHQRRGASSAGAVRKGRQAFANRRHADT